MARFTPDPTVEASVAFQTVKPGIYRMRVAEISEHTSKAGKNMLKVKLEYVDTSSAEQLDGSPATHVGNLFDYLMTDKEYQWKLRSFVEACGQEWIASGDTDLLVGQELDVKVKTEEYNGELSNKVDRYLKAR